jgi:hypothetical protein
MAKYIFLFSALILAYFTSCNSSKLTCSKFYTYKSKTINIKGITTKLKKQGVDVGDVSVGEISIDPKYVVADSELQRMDLIQTKLCEQIKGLPAKDTLRRKKVEQYIDALLLMLKIGQKPASVDSISKISTNPKNVNFGPNYGVVGDVNGVVNINNDAPYLDASIQDLVYDGTNSERYTRAEEYLVEYFKKHEFRDLYLNDNQLLNLYQGIKLRPHFAQKLLPLLCHRKNAWADTCIQNLLTDPEKRNIIDFEAVGNYFSKLPDVKIFEVAIANYISRYPAQNFFNLLNTVFTSPDRHLEFFFNSTLIANILDTTLCTNIENSLNSYHYTNLVKQSLLYKECQKHLSKN